MLNIDGIHIDICVRRVGLVQGIVAVLVSLDDAVLFQIHDVGQCELFGSAARNVQVSADGDGHVYVLAQVIVVFHACR